MDVVAIGAHPDDIELGAGGAISLHARRGDSVTFLIVTNGSAVESVDETLRLDEAHEAADVLGVKDVRFLDFPDTQVPYDDRLVKSIESNIGDIQPDRIYTHSQKDTHQDHRKTALSSIAATRKFDNVLAYEAPSSRSSFEPQYYVPFSESVLEEKIESIRLHESQSQKKYMESEAMRGLARFRGRQANSVYAESFEVIRAVDRFDGHTVSRL